MPNYTLNMPQATQTLAQTQQPINDNFQNVSDSFNVNHVSLLDVTPANRGKHEKVVMPNQAAGPATAATEGALYTKAGTGESILYWRRSSSSTEVPMTIEHGYVFATNGRSFLPGGLLIQWGQFTITGGNSTDTVNFSTAFTVAGVNTAPFSVQLTNSRKTNGGENAAFIAENGAGVPQITATNFKAVSAASNAHTCYWMAIGPST